MKKTLLKNILKNFKKLILSFKIRYIKIYDFIYSKNSFNFEI